MNSKEALEILKSLPSMNSDERVNLDIVKHHDLIRFGLVFGQLDDICTSGTTTLLLKAYITEFGKEMISNPAQFCDWWDKLVSINEPIYTESCVKLILHATRGLVFQALGLPSTGFDTKLPDVAARGMEEFVLGKLPESI